MSQNSESMRSVQFIQKVETGSSPVTKDGKNEAKEYPKTTWQITLKTTLYYQLTASHSMLGHKAK